MDNIATILGLLALMAALVAIARRLGLPYPILLVVGGLLISAVPVFPRIELDPEVVFLLFLPPILTSAGFFTPIQDFRANLRAIGLLAIGLVLFTTAVVALVARTLVPELPWAAAFALGAIVAPPDAVAATSVATGLNLPRRIVTVLEGESLVNDASALVAYRVAVAAAAAGTFSLGQAGIDFVVASVGGVVVGLLVSWLTNLLLPLTDDTPVQIIITFLVSFASYLLAEALHVSGVLAAVTLGLYLGQRSARLMSSAARLQGTAVWEIVVFLLNGLVFILIGLQLPAVLEELALDPAMLLAYTLVVSLAVVLARFVWVFPATYLPRYLSPSLRERDPYPPWQHIVVISWAGMRGIVSLAAALSLPLDFPGRSLILALTFGVILCTLVGQGLSLGWLIRRLGVVDDGGQAREENKARLVAAQAALARLAELADEPWTQEEHLDGLRRHYEQRNERFAARYDGDGDDADAQAESLRRLVLELIDAETAALLLLRDSGTINDEVLRRVQRDLDIDRMRLA